MKRSDSVDLLPRAFECFVKGTDWVHVEIALTAGKAKHRYWRSVHEAWDGVPFTAIRARCLGKPQLNRAAAEKLAHVAQYRCMPWVRVGMKVESDSGQGVIAGGNDSCNFDVLFTSGKYRGQIGNCHPMELTYEERA